MGFALMRVLVDTQILIWGMGRVDLAASVLQVIRQEPHTLILSLPLQDQIRRVGRRLGGKDWAGSILMHLWKSYQIDFVQVTQADVVSFHQQYPDLVPREDIGIFLTAVHGRADIMISENHAFVRQAAEAQNLFTCLNMEDFLTDWSKKLGEDNGAIS